MRAAIERQQPPMRGGRRFKLLYVTQASLEDPSPFQAPQFVFFVNDPRLMPDSYLHYLTARIREKWEFPGLPVLIKQRGREKNDPTEES